MLKRLWELTYRQARRVVVLLVGGTVLLLGVALVFLPGPAVVVIPAGLAILSLEFAWARAFLARVRACPPQKGFERVSLPGELERDEATRRRRDGIAVDDLIWHGIAEAASRVGIDGRAFSAP